MTQRSAVTMTLLTVSIVLAACGDPGRSAVEPRMSPGAASAAKAAAKTDTAMANLVFADSMNVAPPGSVQWAPTGIRGDGRDRFGQPAAFSEYQGRYCGVSAFLGVDGGQGLNADADVDYTSAMASSCGSARTFRFYYDGAMTPTFSFAPHFWVLNLGSLAVGQSMTQGVFFGIQQANCQRLYFDTSFPPAANVLITRLQDTVNGGGVTVKRWQVQSQSGHKGMCVMLNKNGSLASTGVSHYAPFSYVVTEVPAPAPRYP